MQRTLGADGNQENALVKEAQAVIRHIFGADPRLHIKCAVPKLDRPSPHHGSAAVPKGVDRRRGIGNHSGYMFDGVRNRFWQ